MAVTVGRAVLVEANLLLGVGVDNAYGFVFSRMQGDPAVKTPVDLTLWSAASQIRTAVGGDLLLDLSPYIEMDVSGNITINVPATATQTTALNATSAGVWDLELTDGDQAVLRFASGTVSISPEVTVEIGP